METVKLVVAYEGTHYFGWQKAKEGSSIEGELEKAFLHLFQKEVPLTAASRTDRGVHATGQIVSVTLPKPFPLDRLAGALHNFLPPDIRILSVSPEKSSFHPSLDAVSKEYEYTVVTREVLYPFEAPFSWHYPKSLAIEPMLESSRHLIGKHDFSPFANSRKEKKDPITEIFSLSIETDGSKTVFRITGKSFLYKMVRNLVGTLVYIGSGKLKPEIIRLMFTTKKRSLGGVCAPPSGLVLKQVVY